jgi:hypothetical protein
MKRVLLAAFSLMLLSSIPTGSAIAQTQATLSYNAAMAQVIPQLTPSDLASFAYRGYFKSQGISSYAALIQDHSAGKVTPRDIVQAAVNASRLPASTLDDRSYLNALDNQLRELNLH